MASHPHRSEGGSCFLPTAPCKGHDLHGSLSLTHLLLTRTGERVTVTRLPNYTKNTTHSSLRNLCTCGQKKTHQPGRGTLQLNSLLNPEMNGEPERGCTDRPWAQFLPQPPTRLWVHLSPSLHLPF